MKGNLILRLNDRPALEALRATTLLRASLAAAAESTSRPSSTYMLHMSAAIRLQTAWRN